MKPYLARITIAAAIAALLLAGAAAAQTYQINWYSINSGGGVSSGGTYMLSASIGQPVAGRVESVSLLHWIGFWTPEETAAPPITVATLSQAKLIEDGILVSISGKIATSGADDFDGFFYLEEEDRSSGIRVRVPSWPIAGLEEGKEVSVTGTLGTTLEGEREIVAPAVIVAPTDPLRPVRPLGMSNRSIGGGNLLYDPITGSGQKGVVDGIGLNNIGLLISTWGWITGSGPGYIVIDDGSGVSTRVDTTGLVGIPTEGYVTIIGISSMRTGGYPVVLPRRENDLQGL